MTMADQSNDAKALIEGLAGGELRLHRAEHAPARGRGSPRAPHRASDAFDRPRDLTDSGPPRSGDFVAPHRTVSYIRRSI